MIDRLSEAEGFLAVSDPFLELSLLGQNPGQMNAARHTRKSDEASAVPASISFDQLQDFQKRSLGPSIVARQAAGRAEVEISCHLESKILERLGNRLGALAKHERFGRMPSEH